MGEVKQRERLKGEAGANKNMGAITLLHTRAIFGFSHLPQTNKVRFA